MSPRAKTPKKAITTIVKRNGEEQLFDSQKIKSAIAKAGRATQEFDESIAEKLTQEVLGKVAKELSVPPRVEDIQNMVEQVLMESPYKKTARAYILYRDQHKKIRDITSASSVELIDSYLDQMDWKVRENSNMGYSLQGLNNYIFSEVSKVYWLNKIYPTEIRKAHNGGDLHVHDLGTLSIYCVGWDLMDLLLEGFKGVAGKTASSPAKHFRTALGQMVNFMYTLQGEAAGAIAFSNFDTLLAPFIRNDNLTEAEVTQAMQEFIFNMNVPTRVGFQTPFSNITLDLTPSPNFKDQKVIIGGKEQSETYGEFQKEMTMLNDAFFKVMAKGDSEGRVFTFPIPTVNVTKDFDWENKDLAGLWDITAKYGIPYFSNFINSDMKPEDTRSMCCRLRLDLDELDRRGGGLFGANALTGSVGVVTINMPRIGFTSNGDTKLFFEKLGALMDTAKTSLEIKRKILERFTDANLYPYSKFYLRNIKKTHGAYWANHFSTIGLIGLNEAVQNMMGVSLGDKKGHKFAEQVLDFMRERLIEYQKESGNLYNLEATPAEGTSYSLALKDKKAMPEIIVANEKEYQAGAEPFYTNSSHLPVNYTDDVFEALDIQDPLQTKYTGGTVVHLFLGEKISDPSLVPKMVKKICEKYKLPYFTFTPTFSVCSSHGYVSGEHESCPTCKSKCEIYSRVVGYLRPVAQWNNGKQAEFGLRETYLPKTVV
ncbi:MAG: ribonucleoside triphosphate reductase [Candidatus Nomurabacteria bacterium]|nr:ribonucleoside triphosphate reductase [Candidatus Nomurabacteria bacterium]